METIKKNIFERLINFQKDLKAIEKSSTAKISGTSKSGQAYNMSYDYAPLEVVQLHIQKPLAANGLGYFQNVGNGVVTTIFDVDGDTIMSDVYPLTKSGSAQDYGKEITYAKRYQLCALLGLILINEDNDANDLPKATEPVKTAIKVEPKKVYTREDTQRNFYKLANEKLALSPPEADEILREQLGVTNTEEITQEHYMKAFFSLRNKWKN